MGTYNFSDIFDISALQGLLESLSAALGVGICIRDQHGKYLFRSRECGVCCDLLEEAPVGSDEQAPETVYQAFTPCVRYCQAAGLTDAVIPVMNDTVLAAVIQVGWVRLSEQEIDDAEYLTIARALQLDEEQFLESVHAVPLLTRTHFDNILNAVSLIMEHFSQLGHKNMYLKSVISSLESQEFLHQQEKNVLANLAEKDSMTGLYNRRKFEEVVALYARLKTRKICMISADANFLKLTNDIFGHESGDHLLQAIAKIMNDLAKSDWLVARCGGDEFRVVLPDTTLETALDYCRRVARNCRRDKSLALPLSVALGAAEWNSEKETLQDCFSRADAKMYQNKTALKHELRIPNYIMERLYDRQVLSKEVVEFTASLTLDFALYLNFTGEHAKEASLAAHFQDIGMAKLPESAAIRGQSRTEEETTQIQMHVTHSYTMARQFDELYKLADIIHCSHENWDGSGYPSSLKGDHVPIESRIIHLVSDYARRTHPTVTGGYYSEEAMKDRLARESGSVYDPNLVSRFLEFLQTRELH
ncbi:diguanylate cyclase [Acetatifactor muris]|uniref:Putative diguanylate cyclase YdaM n=1 Tax=Acetatifactor muris TaxID=879566 RepID=A0A2K4ZF18_9FIRM|nr:diguanylate cyclase [Acetatifactor muris]MCI8800690.1 diguanylate cyclase [Lachnospiraceae bacterium]MCR2047244.1 diguanylate cyclase [Acetatifactor muris]SOY29049.1 putative diguanylate cyclase YdaM [Acetatifactor muris]